MPEAIEQCVVDLTEQGGEACGGFISALLHFRSNPTFGGHHDDDLQELHECLDPVSVAAGHAHIAERPAWGCLHRWGDNERYADLVFRPSVGGFGILEFASDE